MLTLGLGIGVGTAIFSVLNGALLRPLPYPDADRIVWMSDGYVAQFPSGSSQVYLTVRRYREEASLVEHVAAYSISAANFSSDDGARRVSALVVDPPFFGALGLPPLMGRDFTAEDNQVGNESVVILSHGLWIESFGGSPDILGTDILLDDEPYTVIGVAHPEMRFSGDPELFVPFGYEGRDDLYWGARGINSVARLAEGATIASATAELKQIYAQIIEEHPSNNEGWTVHLRPLPEFLLGSGHETLWFIGGAALLVLLLSLVNVTNLMLVRSEGRHREVAVRLAMGAGRAGLIPLFVGEGLLLSLAGAAVGIAVAAMGVPGLLALYGNALPRADEIGLDATALGFAALAALFCGIVVGLIPALRADTRDLGAGLRDGARGQTRGTTRLRTGLVVVEIALSVILVTGAGLLIRSVWELNAVDLGVEAPEQVLTLRISLPSASYPDGEDVVAFHDGLHRDLEALPGVAAAGITSRLPLYGGLNITNLTARDHPDTAHFVEVRYVDAGFFRALGLPVLAGRLWSDGEGFDSVPSVVINAELARELFAVEGPEVASVVGRAIDLNWYSEDGLRIGAVVGDLRDRGITADYPPGFYLPHGPRTAQRSGILTLRSDPGVDPVSLVTAIRDRIRSRDPGLPVYSIERLSDVFERRIGGARLAMSLLALFGGLALLLGGVGIYGVTSYGVSQRTRELGIRLALGAPRDNVAAMVLREVVTTTALGVVLGVVGALASGRLVASLLYGVSSTNPATYLAVVAVLTAVALMAAWLPARRASSVDPLVALRHE